MSWNILPKNVLQYFLEKIKSKFMLISNHDILGAKNILPFPYAYGTGTHHGLTITVNDDGSITAQGAPTQTLTFLISNNIIEDLALWQGSEMIFSEWEVENQDAFAALLLGQSTPISEVRGDYKLTVTSEMIQQGVAFILYFEGGVDLTTPITFKPMVRLATDPDHTWRSPALTNKQLTDRVFYLNYAKSHVSANPSTTTGTLTGIEIDGTGYTFPGSSSVTGVKGSAEQNYRTGDVNITPANVGAVSKSGDTMTGCLIVKATEAGGSYDEGIRINAGKNGYATLCIGGAESSTSGTSEGQFWIGTNPTNNSYKRKLYIAQNGSTGSGTYFEADSASRTSPALRLGWSGSVADGNNYAVTGDVVYDSDVKGLHYTGTATDCFTVHQTSGSFMGRSNWASYLICNHGNGATYYSQTIALPFWSVPLYRRLEGGTDKGWKEFITAENIGSQSVSYAGNAGTVNGKTVGTNVPSNAVFTDTNNAVTQNNTSDGNWYRVLYSVTADDTTRTEGARKGRLYFKPNEASFKASNGSVETFNLGKGWLYLNGGSTIVNTITQHLYLRSSSETDYGLYIGIQDNVWAVMPPRKDYMRLGTPNYRWNQIYSSNSAISTSDRKEKKDIESLDEFARTFIMALNPVSYKFKNGNSGRTHYGMIAQDVEEEMSELGMTAMDFAGLCKDQKRNTKKMPTAEKDAKGNTIYQDVQVDVPGEYLYALRYEEFIAPVIKTEQLQQEDINSLKEEISLLKEEIALLKQRLQILEDK